MKPFKWMFEEQNATEIEYKGKQVRALYRYDKKGKIFWNGKRLKKERRRFPQIIFEETWVPKEFELEVILEEGNIAISNGCLRPTTETIACFVDDFAMIKEKLGEDKFRFYCNDIDWEDDFDDLIFDLEIEKVAYED